mgnify:CR=1 FL=1
MKHLVSIDDLNKNEIQEIFAKTQTLKKFIHNYRTIKEYKILVNLFYEPSTRTNSSFFTAMTKLGGKVLNINNVSYSSVSKGESLKDTIITMGNYCDIIALRSKNTGDALKASLVSKVPIINAGDGNGEHPTQTLLDLYTIWEKFKRIEDLTITFIGDIENSRTIHSLDKSLKNCQKYYRDTYNQEPWPKSDIYYLTRVQKERGSIGSYSMTEEHVKTIPDNSIVLHPFPRNEEIPEWFDDDPRAKYFEQMENGLYVRMSLILKYTN